MLLEGLHIPLTTPFHPDGRLNPRKLAANVVRYSRTPAAGLIVLGPSGEPTLLSDDETREALSAAAQAAAPEKVLIAGISRDSVAATLALADHAASLDYDAILVGVPSVLASEFQLSYRSMTNDLRHQLESRLREQRIFFQSVADRSSLPVILLHEDHREVGLPEASELASHPNVIGILGAGKSHTMQQGRISHLLKRTSDIRREVTVTPIFAAVTARMKKTTGQSALLSTASLTGAANAVAEPPAPTQLRSRTRSIGFQILSARTPDLLDSLQAGAVGIAPALAAAAPQACYEIFAAWKDADQSLAEEKQTRLREAARLAETLGPGALKFACDLNGYYGGPPRLPHLPLTGAERTALEHLMKDVHN